MNNIPNLLIVDDSQENLFLIEAITRKINVKLIKAYSGQEALDKTEGVKLALAIIDVRMPGMNGYELAIKMNEKRSDENVPVIFLTASHFSEVERLKGYGSGAVDFIFRPVDNHILLSKINAFLNIFLQKQTVIKEVNERRQMEEKLRRYQIELEKKNKELSQAKSLAESALQKYSELFDLAPAGYFTLSALHIVQEVNHIGAHILEKEHSDIIGSKFDKFISPDTIPAFNAFLEKLFVTKTRDVYEMSVATTNGQPKFVFIEGRVIGNGMQCLINVVDITERKKAERTLRESENKYRTMLNASPDGIILIDLNGIITEVSEIGLGLLGAETKEEILGSNISRYVPLNEKKNLREMIEKTLNEGLTQNIGLVIRKKNQSEFPGEVSATLVQGSDGAPLAFMIIIRDISQRKKAQTIQIHADRMMNLGEMASGIAHEINQPLNNISMVMDRIIFEIDRTETVNIGFVKERSEKIFDNIIRIRNIIDHIRAFSRSDDNYVLSFFSINTAITNAISIISEQFKHFGINLDLNLENTIPEFFGNTYKFEQVIVNLLINAKDAVIERKNSHSDYTDMMVGIKSFIQNKDVVVEITDNGIGIVNDNINNVMLPFFTTKEEGKGTGLGLSICYQIIKEMGGSIDIISTGTSGAKIRIVLDVRKNKKK